MKFYKDYGKEPYSFVVNDLMILSSDNPLRFRKNLLQKWILVRKSKQSITKQSSKQFRQKTVKIFTLSSGNVSK